MDSGLPNWMSRPIIPEAAKGKLPDWMKPVEPLVGDEQYKTWLRVQMNAPDPFPNSTAPVNPLIGQYTTEELIKMYEEVLPEYEFVASDGADPSKFDYRDNPNTGYKLHLSVPLEEIKFVSDYLKSNGYVHKFLTRGDPDDGKEFTIYIGSYKLTRKLAEEISHDLNGHLCRPIDKSEVEFAPNIAGRFTSDDKTKYYKYPLLGVRGIPVTLEFGEMDTVTVKTDPKITRLAFEASFNQLTQEFGEYFTG